MNINILRSNELNDRIDVAFYNKEYFKTINLLDSVAKKDNSYEVSEIRDILSKDEKDITGGATPLGAVYLEEGVPFIRVQNVRKNKLELNDLKYIPRFIHEGELNRSQLRPNDVLLTITGVTYGLSAVVPQELTEANMNQHSVRIRVDSSKLLPFYLSFFLNSKLGKVQSDRFVTGSTRPALDYESVKSIKILFPKNIHKQETMVNESQKYLNLAEDRHTEFNRILSHCVSLMSELLDIEIKSHRVETFVLNVDKTELNRLDCYSHSPTYRKILSNLNEAEKFGKCKLIKGGELNIVTERIDVNENESHICKYVDIGNTEKQLGLILGYEEDVLINLPSRARQIMKENDILLPRPIGSAEGIIIVPKEYDGQLCSTGFIQIRPTNYDNAVLLWSILKSQVVQEQLFYLQSGSLQPEITPKTFMKRVLIPIPVNEKIQNNIIIQMKEKLKELKTIKDEYKQNKETAENVFTKALLSYAK